MKLINFLILLTTILFSFNLKTNANINLSVSPIKYEIKADKWTIIKKSATIYNRSDKTYTIVTGKSDFDSIDNTWNPHFIRKNTLEYTWKELANWINIDTESFTILPWESKKIFFTITVPENATPWWHYWAVFFKNNNSEQTWWNQIKINVDYWVLILVRVNWKIIESWNVKNTVITGWGGWSRILMDKCPIADLTSSRYDGKCIDDFLNEWKIKDNIEQLEKLKVSDINNKQFNIDFDTLFINEWNTHLKPIWKIKLIDEDWKEIKWIWKKIIKNDAWAIIGEKIVDYIPINDNKGNVLPSTKRKFESEWKWFPYEAYDENWKKIIKYWTPEEYYTRQNVEERWFLLPWERVNERINKKKINAIIDLWYTNKDWELIEFNSAKDFYVNYKDKYIWLNPYFFIISFFIVLIIWILLLIFRKKKVKCIKCKKKINKDMKVCPYCLTEQKEKKDSTKNSVKKTEKNDDKTKNKKKDNITKKNITKNSVKNTEKKKKS